MKILAKNTEGYITEISRKEMTFLTGKPEPVNFPHAHDHGTIVNIPELCKHIKDMEKTKAQRSKAVELLKAAINVIETVPKAFEAPAVQESEPTENQQQS